MESLPYFFLCLSGAVVLLAAFSVVGAAVGLVGYLLTRRRGLPWNPLLAWLFATLSVLGVLAFASIIYAALRAGTSSTGALQVYSTALAQFTPQPEFRVYDEEVAPYILALRQVDREALGFTPIEVSARIELDRTSGSTATYDVMLHIYGSTSRTIAFGETPEGITWLGEQETHYGPFGQEVVITFDTVYISGAPLNQLTIHYFGDDTRLLTDNELTLDDVWPVIEEWRRLSTQAP